MVSKTDLRRIQAALEIASSSDGSYMLGALVVSGGRVLGRGANRRKNDPKYTTSNWSVHAETAALRSVKATRRRSTLYVARVTPGGLPALARPCPACWDEAVRRGVTRVVYTTDAGAYEERVST